MRFPSSVVLALVGILAGVGRAPGQAQDFAVANRAPRFLMAPGGAAVPVSVDVRRTPVLRRRISVAFDGVTLKEALAEISRLGDLPLLYSGDDVPLNARVRLRADNISVAGALSEVLMDAGVDVLMSADGRAALVRRGTLPQGGTVTGRVTDARTQQGVSGARVFLERTRWGTTTDSGGSYRLTEVAPGAYTLVTRRIGYRPHTQPVTVEAERETTVDVALQPAPSELEAVVVTATGEQRLLELGHVVGRINADSIVREAPVSSLSELLTGRVPGLQVFQTQGTVGGRVTLQLRGPNSFNLDNQPIIVVDGVRYTTGDRRVFGFGPGDVEAASPLNDINPNDIESVEVVKGPSAATLYGTDAANGVLVITTKRGRPGPARWNTYAKASSTAIPARGYPDIYWGWGTVSGVPNNRSVSCTLARLASGACTQQDSITVLPNATNDPELSIFGTKPRWEYGASVAGGREDLRYYFSADFEDATGPVQLPRGLAEAVRERRGAELPREWRDPNGFTKLNLRSTVSAVLGARADLRLTTGYVRNDTRSLSRFNSGQERFPAFFTTPANLDSAYGSSLGISPAQAYAQSVSDLIDRFFVSGTGHWRPAPWLEARATVGLDFGSTNRYALARPGDQPNNSTTANGAVEDTRVRQVATTADLGATATARRGRVTLRTSVGAQYARNLHSASGAVGLNLPPGGAVVQRALNVFTQQQHVETVVLGGYVEEMLGLNERFFLTGAVRMDGASTFGRDFQAAFYPKVGASWLLSHEPFLPRLPWLDELRLRYAFGASGKQPPPAAARPGFVALQMDLGGQRVNAVVLTSPGNPDLRPERVREHEFGFDASALANRLTLQATWYRRSTVDQIISQSGPPGRGPISLNLGLTTQRGFEAQLDARVVDNRLLSWNLALRHADFSTLLVDIGEGFELRTSAGGFVEGYPLGGRWTSGFPPVSWADQNGDGIISSSEIQRADTAFYAGQSFPPRSQTLTTVIGLLERRVRVSAVFERRAGHTQFNENLCLNRTCRAAVDRTTPFAEQVRAERGGSSNQIFPEKADFTRLREVTVALDLPAHLTRAARVSRATLVVSARNLALWTGYSGVDPESGTVTPSLDPAGGGRNTGIPQSRALSVRLDVAF